MANTPNIRFKGFTEDWEQRKLGDYVQIVSGDAPSRFSEGECNYVKVDDLNNAYKTVVETQNRVAEHKSIQKVKKGSVIFPKRGAAILTNKVRILGIDSYMDTNMMALSSEEFDTEFLYILISKEGLYKIADTSTIPQINNKHIVPYEIMVPKLKEQKAIGECFQKMDNLITLHQRKCDEIKELKKFMLQKMFPKNGEKIPEIRFEGFTDDWEQRKLGEVATRVTRKNTNLESTLPLTISAQYGLVDQITFFNNRVASKDVSGYYLIKKGEFAYNKSYSDGYPWGAIKRLERYEMGVLSTLYIIFRIDESKVDSQYLTTFYDTNLWHKDVSDRAAEGARNHGLLNITPNDFFDTAVRIPKSIEEQVQIGSYFQHLDNLITLHQRKCDELKEVKKYMLQNMFPQKG